MKPTSFPQLLHAFFHDWLVQQRNASHHTIVSYRDSWRMFLRFVGARKARPVAKLDLSDFTEAEVLAFLQDIEQVRKSSIGTRNCRLSALHSFFSFVADREPLAAAQCAAVLRIPTKQASKPEIRELDENEITAILAQPNRNSIEGQRDHAMLAFLYNTGARIQEALNVTPQAIRWEAPFQVRLVGKGRKERTCPLWPETVELDEEEIRDGIEMLLQADGYRVHPARDEDDAIAMARRDQPDLILVNLDERRDVVTAAARRVWVHAGLRKSIPIVMFCITTVAEGADVEIGENTYATWPDNFDQLGTLLSRLLVGRPLRFEINPPPGG